jgi:hypothetical protein
MDLNTGGFNLSITSAGIPSAITKMAFLGFCAERSLNRKKTNENASIRFMLITQVAAIMDNYLSIEL